MAVGSGLEAAEFDLAVTPLSELNAALHANDAQMWEPEPAKVYVWERERV